MPTQPETSVANDEFETCYAELMQLTPHQTLLKFLQRHDQRIQQQSAKSEQNRACGKGCGFCCHLKVIADAVEIFAMVDYVKTHLEQAQLDQIIQSARSNIEQARPLSFEQQATINQQCPLLVDNSCVIYPVRSIECRNYHSTDADNCRLSFQNPHDLDIISSNIPELWNTASASSKGFMAALHYHGYDDRVYDHNSAFIEALEDPDCKKRYNAKKRAFKNAKYND